MKVTAARIMAYALVGPWMALERAADIIYGEQRRRKVNSLRGWLDCVKRGVLAGLSAGIACVVASAFMFPIVFRLRFATLLIYATVLLCAYIGATVSLFLGGHDESEPG